MEVQNGNWKSLAITRIGPFISHICFADDLMFFGEASTNHKKVMMSTLQKFCDASGEKVSLVKSKILVSSNVPHNTAMDFSAFCGIPLTKDFGKYLGVKCIIKMNLAFLAILGF